MLKYEQIKGYMKEEALKPSSASAMPKVRELMRRFSVSSATVTRAIKELEIEGVIVCRHGSGIVAARPCGENSAVGGVPADSAAGTVVIAAVDSDSEVVWNNVFMTEQHARSRKLHVVNCKIHQDTAPGEIVEFVKRQSDCRGLIMLFGYGRLSAAELGEFAALHIPVAFINSMFSYEPIPENLFVLQADPAAAAGKAATHLLAKGHRSIAFVRNEPQSELGDQYIHAFAKCLRKAGVEFDASHVFSSAIRNWGDSMKEAQRVTAENLEVIRRRGITALVFTSSPGAFAAIQTLSAAGLRVPSDISVLGVSGGDSHYFKYSTPPLTLCDADRQRMCKLAVDIVADGKSRSGQLIRVPAALIERGSVGDLRKTQPEV